MSDPHTLNSGPVLLYVPAYNAAATVAACVASALSQTIRPEVLVMDDGSTDDTAALAERTGARVISFGENRGLAAARNRALREATGRYVASLDADVAADPSWLETLLAFMELDADGGYAGVGGKLVERFTDRTADRWRLRHIQNNWGDAPLDDAEFVFGSNTLYRTEALRSVGGFPTSCRTNFEDVFIADRLRASGYRLAYRPEAIAYHLRRDTVRSVLRNRWQRTYARDDLIPESARALLSRWRKHLSDGYWYARSDLEESVALAAIGALYPVTSAWYDLAQRAGRRRF